MFTESSSQVRMPRGWRMHNRIRRSSRNQSVHGVPVNLEFVPTKDFQSAPKKLDLDLVRWINNSITIYERSDAIRKLRSKVREFVPALTDRLINYSVTEYDDALGSLSRGDTIASIMSCRRCNQAAVQALLLSEGGFNLKPRWLHRGLLSSGHRNLLRDYSLIQGLDNVDKRRAQWTVMKTAEFVNRIVNQFMYPGMTSFTKPGVLFKGPVRDPMHIWLRWLDGRAILLGPGRIFELNTTGTGIWELCDGNSTITEIAQQLGKAYGAPIRQTLKDCTIFVKQLEHLKLIRRE